MKDTLSSQNESSNTTVASNTKKQQITDSREEQKNKALRWINKELKLGDKWYLINSDWYTRWANFVDVQLNNDNDSLKIHKSNSITNFLSPDKINNKTLLDNENHLKQDLTEEVDYYTICEELWNYLVNIYGITQKEDTIERYVIDDGIDGETSLKIEMHRVKVNYSLTNSGTVATEEMSRQTTIEEVADKLRIIFKLPPRKPVRLYFKSKDSTGHYKFHQVEISNRTTLNTSGYSPNEIMCLDVQEPDGKWSIEKPTPKPSMLKTESSVDMPPQVNTISSSQPPPAPLIAPSPLSTQQSATLNFTSTRQAYSNRQSHHDFRPGLCGLSNLGNTCFMNSSIQCMSNVPPLTDYFRSGDYKKEINVYNPLGRKGEIAEAYADLVNEMWSGNNSYTIPRNFKLHLSRFAPQFTGFQQQDSHELLAFLLDGLHEDLNRIIKKPYIELGSHVGKTDEQFAEESWQDHKKRNDSIIVDLFHGLLKSTLNCLECKEISIKFDPFCYLSLPLPSKKERLIEVYFVSLDTNVPLTKYKVSVVKNGTINDLCASLEQLVQVPKQRMCVCDVYTCKFFKVYDSTEAVTNIRERDDIYVYELANAYSNADYLRVKVHLKEKSAYQQNSFYFGLPLYMTMPKTSLKYGTLYQNIHSSLKRFLKDPIVSSSEEINSKLNNSLNVRDEDWDEEVENKNKEEKETELNGESASKEQKADNAESEKLFNLIISKNDNIDYESLQQNTPLNDDSLIDWQNMNSNTQGNVPTTVSIIAEFGQNFAKHFYNKKAIEDYKEHPSCNAQLVKKKDVISLSDCFNLYTKTEDLSEQDYWYCSKCKQHQPSTKKFDLWSLPPVLVVHLKRFSYSRLYRDKIDTQVEFPLTDLDLSNYLINKNVNKTTKYNLIAVSNHYGSLGGGHYTAYAQNRFDSKWYNFDDSCVSSTDENSVCTSAAYLLIYLRQDIYHNGLSAESVNGKGSQAEKMDL